MPSYDVIRSRDPARSTPRDVLPPAMLAEFREQIVQELGVHYANADLSTSELERRLAIAFAATAPGPLEELVSDLPPLGADLRPAAVRVSAAPHPDGSAERAVLAAFMGATVRKGRWKVPRYLKVVVVMGGGEIDLRQAEFAHGVTDIEVFALMGGVEILLPHGVRVETVGIAVMGGFETNAAAPVDDRLDQPVVRISGLAIMGGVDARMKHPSTKALRKFGTVVAKVRARLAKGKR